ncbi:MAG: hypothetical protein ACRDRB_16090 [Pseudonocardiaceae bacterium]
MLPTNRHHSVYQGLKWRLATWVSTVRERNIRCGVAELVRNSGKPKFHPLVLGRLGATARAAVGSVITGAGRPV